MAWQQEAAGKHAAGTSGPLTMARRSRRADGLARSLSRAGGINRVRLKGKVKPLAATNAHSLPPTLELEEVANCCDRKGASLLGSQLSCGIIRPHFTIRITHQTTHCTRTRPPIHLHSSQWQGTSTSQLWTSSRSDARLATAMAATPSFRIIFDTDSHQLGLPREPCTVLPARVPEARWSEDLGEGAYPLRKSLGRQRGMTWSQHHEDDPQPARRSSAQNFRITGRIAD